MIFDLISKVGMRLSRPRAALKLGTEQRQTMFQQAIQRPESILCGYSEARGIREHGHVENNRLTW